MKLHFKPALTALFLLVAVLGQSNHQAQPAKSPEASPTQSEAGKTLDAYIKDQEDKKAKSPTDQILPDASGIDALDEPTKAKALAAYREYYDYRISGYQHRREVFKWQLLSSKVIFAVVILLVLSGVYFSGMQFHRSLGRKPKRAFAGATTGDEAADKIAVEEEQFASDATQIEASLKGIKVTSSILGVIILVISLLFFYMYLIYVYPIHEIL